METGRGKMKSQKEERKGRCEKRQNKSISSALFGCLPPEKKTIVKRIC